MLRYFELISLIINAALLVYLVIQVNKIKKILINLSDANYANNLLNEFEKGEYEKQRAFDERIAMLKEELSMSNTIDSVSKKGTPAEELHPLVKNLPSDSVRMYESVFSGIEYAE